VRATSMLLCREICRVWVPHSWVLGWPRVVRAQLDFMVSSLKPTASEHFS